MKHVETHNKQPYNNMQPLHASIKSEDKCQLLLQPCVASQRPLGQPSLKVQETAN